MSLFPDKATAIGFSTIEEVRSFYGLADEPWRAWHDIVGNPDIRIMAALPAGAVVENCMRVVLPGNLPLSPTQAAQIGLVWRLCKRISWTKGGGDYDNWKDEDPWTSPPPAAPPSTTPALPPKGLKMSQVIDQSDESEFLVDSVATADRWYQRYVATMGAPPQEEEEASIEQLSALNRRVHTLDQAPYVDLAVWLPYGSRALRTVKFRAWIPDGQGGYFARELPGPANYQQWLAAWRVFQTASVMLDVFPLATLQLYERHIERLVKLYGSAWHLIVLADEKARGEKLARIRLKVTSDIALGKPPPDRWDATRPWIACLHLLVADTQFWDDQVRSPANAWLAQGSRGAPRGPTENFAADNINGGVLAIEPPIDSSASRRSARDRRQNKKRKWKEEKEELVKLRAAAVKNKGDGKGKDSNLKSKDQSGSDLCFSWDSGKGSCSTCQPGDPCKAKITRIHKCRVCLSPSHRSSDCPQRV